MNVKCYMIQQCITMAILETLLHVLKNNAVQSAWLASTPFNREIYLCFLISEYVDKWSANNVIEI